MRRAGARWGDKVPYLKMLLRSFLTQTTSNLVKILSVGTVRRNIMLRDTVDTFACNLREDWQEKFTGNTNAFGNQKPITRFLAQLYPSALKGVMFSPLNCLHHSKFLQILNITKLFHIAIPIQTLHYARCLPHFQNGGFYREKV